MQDRRFGGNTGREIDRNRKVADPGLALCRTAPIPCTESEYTRVEVRGDVDVPHGLHGIEGHAEPAHVLEALERRSDALVEREVDTVRATQHDCAQFRRPEIHGDGIAVRGPVHILRRCEPPTGIGCPHHEAEDTTRIPGLRTGPYPDLLGTLEADQADVAVFVTGIPEEPAGRVDLLAEMPGRQ